MNMLCCENFQLAFDFLLSNRRYVSSGPVDNYVSALAENEMNVGQNEADNPILIVDVKTPGTCKNLDLNKSITVKCWLDVNWFLITLQIVFLVLFVLY